VIVRLKRTSGFGATETLLVDRWSGRDRWDEPSFAEAQPSDRVAPIPVVCCLDVPDGLTPTVPPNAAPASATSDKPNDEEEQRGADGGVDNCVDNSGTKMNTELRWQPVADEGTNNSDY
jgi:hypothetical protein